MINPLKTQASTSAGLLLARLAIGAFFLGTGCTKVFHIGVSNFVAFASRSPNIPKWAPPDAVHGYLHAVPFLEIAVGVLLILGLFSRVIGLIASLMILSFIVGYTRLADPNLPFTPNLIYLAVTLLVLLAGPGRFSLDAVLFGRKKVAV